MTFNPSPGVKQENEETFPSIAQDPAGWLAGHLRQVPQENLSDNIHATAQENYQILTENPIVQATDE